MSRGKIQEAALPERNPELDMMLVAAAESLRQTVRFVVNQGFDAHRLAYVHEDEDNPLPNGRPSQLFVCKCQEAFDRSSYNEHIRDKYKEVN